MTLLIHALPSVLRLALVGGIFLVHVSPSIADSITSPAGFLTTDSTGTIHELFRVGDENVDTTIDQVDLNSLKVTGASRMPSFFSYLNSPQYDTGSFFYGHHLDVAGVGLDSDSEASESVINFIGATAF